MADGPQAKADATGTVGAMLEELEARVVAKMEAVLRKELAAATKELAAATKELGAGCRFQGAAAAEEQRHQKASTEEGKQLMHAELGGPAGDSASSQPTEPLDELRRAMSEATKRREPTLWL
uniref:Uncharacterized protein n=1 Tax=Haptolina brevifila TaxID=156173 RepID=A0A7S2NSB9_9EUKA